MRLRFGRTIVVCFSLAGLVVSVASAAVIGYLMQADLTVEAQQEAAVAADSCARTLVESRLTASDLAASMIPAGKHAELDRIVREQLMPMNDIVAVKIWNRDSRLVYSDTGAQVGQRFPMDAAVESAMRGVDSSAIKVRDDLPAGTPATAGGRVLETCVPLRVRGVKGIAGAYEMYILPDKLDSRVRRIQRTVAMGVFGGSLLLYATLFGIVLSASRRLVHEVRDNERLAGDLSLAYDQTIEGWGSALDLRDRETEGHSHRVTEMALRLARALGVPEEQLADVRRGALLHDIGKMGIPDSILLKPGPLDADEWEIMRAHPGHAKQMLEKVGYLKRALEIPYGHHERWDGTGYPQGLAGEEIPLSARMFAVVDVWDARSFDRPYRGAWPWAEVRAHLAGQSGKHFDPDVVAVFLGILDEEAASHTKETLDA